MSLYEKLKEAGIKLDSHESDLYFEMSGRAMRIATQFSVEMKAATVFTGTDGKLWVDVPFAYQPWWEGKVGA
jgi:hypothetical protein